MAQKRDYSKMTATELAMLSSVKFGREVVDYTSSSKSAYVPISDASFKGARGAAGQKELENLRKTHFVLGDNKTMYETTNSMRPQDGRRPQGGSGISYGDLLKSSMKMGSDKTNYTSAVQDQYRPFGADAVAVPSRDAAIKLAAGTQLVLGDDMPDYMSESVSNFSEATSIHGALAASRAEKKSEKKTDDPLAQNGRAQPMSSVLLGRYKGAWASTSIAVRPDPTKADDFTPYKGRGDAMKNAYAANIILGDEAVDYSSVASLAGSNGLVRSRK